MKLLDIGQVAVLTGMRPSTLRYYEEIGLIVSGTRHGLRRQFSVDVVPRLKLIAMGKSAGFSLDEIAAIFGSDGIPNLPRPVLRKRAEDLDRQIHQLTSLRDTLLHVADCRAASHLECPTFRRLLNVASRRAPKNGKSPKRKTT